MKDIRTPDQIERYNTIEQQRADAMEALRASGNMLAADYPDWRREELARKYAPVDAYDPPDLEEDINTSEEE